MGAPNLTQPKIMIVNTVMSLIYTNGYLYPLLCITVAHQWCSWWRRKSVGRKSDNAFVNFLPLSFAEVTIFFIYMLSIELFAPFIVW